MQLALMNETHRLPCREAFWGGLQDGEVMPVGLVFLHGVGQRESDQRWRDALDGALADLGFPDTRTPDVVVVAPDYSHLLSAERPEKSPTPPRTQQPKDSRLQRRRDYESGQARLRRLLGVDDLVDRARGPFHPVSDDVAEGVTKLLTSVHPDLREAGRPASDRGPGAG